MQTSHKGPLTLLKRDFFFNEYAAQYTLLYNYSHLAMNQVSLSKLSRLDGDTL